MSEPFYDLIQNVKDGDYVDAGWRGPDIRTPEENKQYDLISSQIPNLQIIGPQAAVSKMVLWDYSKKVNNGKHFETFFQQSGSCVGNGGGQATWYLSAMEKIRLGENEECKTPFYLLPYGRSRLIAGMRGRGDGSFGAAFAQAIKTDGVLAFDEPGLPKMQTGSGITWGKNIEYEWSDGSRISNEWLNKSRKFTVQSTAKLTSTQDAWDAIANGYACTIASNWGGQMRPQAAGNPAVLLNKRATRWDHQMCVIGIWDHPTLGRIFCILNSWGPDAHGQPVDDSPPGSFWVLESEMDFIIKQGDSFAFSQFLGFPSQNPNYWLI